MALDHMGIPLDFDFPALLALQGGLIAVLGQKQPHFITGTAVGTGTQDRKLNHPATVRAKKQGIPMETTENGFESVTERILRR